jgi:release factor glutamine methyltransferase
MLSLLEIIKRTTDFLETKGVESARLNAEWLVGHALGLKRMQLYLQFERILTEGELEKIRPLVRRRAQREPLQYILGETEWFGLKLKVDRRVLIPRPETELLAENIVKLVGSAPARILDLGTGSGALALGLAKHFPEAVVTAVDLDEDALSLARQNAETSALTERVSFLKSDWFSAISERPTFDLIVANPPYLSAEETAAAEPEVREFEPAQALSSGEGGMAALRIIIAQSPRYLAPTGLLALETGVSQRTELLQLCADAGFVRTESRQDLTGRDSFVFAWLKAAEVVNP